MTLPIVELNAIRSLQECFVTRAITSFASQNRILLNASSLVINQTHLRLQFMNLIVRFYSGIGVIGKRRKIGQLIEARIVTFAYMAIEFQLADIALAARRCTPSDISKATRHEYICI